MMRFALITLIVLSPMAASASGKAHDCGWQAKVVSAVQQARIARVKERKVAEHIASTNPEWPQRFNAAIPLVTPWIYEMKMRDVRTQDLASAWKELCLQQ